MTSPPPPATQRVALLGFGDFERSALVSYLRLSGTRDQPYAEAVTIEDADYVIADADHAGTVDAVLGADRVADTVFIGSLAPDRALAWMMRPIDPLQVFREIGATVALRRAQQQPSSARTSRPLPLLTEVMVPVPAPPVAPAAPAAQETAQARKRKVRAATAERGSAKRAGDVNAPVSALLIDDSEVALRFLERKLQDLGLRTETAADSQSALERMGAQRFDVVFVDVDLGPHSELDGLALCRVIKNMGRPPAVTDGPVVVMVSAHAATTDRVRGSFAGCDAYLGKPLDDDALRRSLRSLGLRLSAPIDATNSRPGNLNSRPTPLDGST